MTQNAISGQLMVVVTVNIVQQKVHAQTACCLDAYTAQTALDTKMEVALNVMTEHF